MRPGGPSEDTTDDEFRDFARKQYIRGAAAATDTLRGPKAARKSGARGLDDMCTSGCHNASRKLLQVWLKECQVPEIQWHMIRVWDQDLKEPKMAAVPFLHLEDMLGQYFGRWPQLLTTLQDHTDMPELGKNLEQARQRANIPADAPVAALGLHGDGVTFQRNKSLEVVSVNFPRMPGWDRIPVFAMEKRHVCKCGCQGRCTWNDILWVISSMFIQLAMGVAGGTRWLLIQCRGDWPFLKQVFYLPDWGNDHFCWKCWIHWQQRSTCRKAQLQTVARRSELDLMQQARETGYMTPLLRCPGFSLWVCVVIDWLHTVDLGVLQDFLGNALWQLAERQPGSTQEARVQVVAAMIKEKYIEHKVPCNRRLPRFTLNCFRPQASKSPKLKCLGAHARTLVPLVSELLEPWQQVDHDDRVMHTIAHAASTFCQLQDTVQSRPYDAQEAASLTERFSTLYVELHRQAEERGSPEWAVKPKFHMMQELIHYCPDLGSPSDFWCYLDETFVGVVARMATARGGSTAPHVAGARVLNKYRMGDWLQAPDYIQDNECM